MKKACTREGMTDIGECGGGKRRSRNDINTILMSEIIKIKKA